MQPHRVPPPPSGGWRETLVSFMSLVSPKWGLQHEAAKTAREELASFRNSRHSRISGKSIPQEGRADFHLEVGYDRRELVDRARQLERDSVIAEGMLSRATENVVGRGFRLQAQSKNPTWNDDVEARWAEWCKKGCDVRKLDDFSSLLALTYRSWLRDGDVGLIKLSDGCLQFVESDQIANPLGNIPTKNHIDGIELDSRGAPVSYLVVRDPDPQWASVRFGHDFTQVPAADFIFLARRQRHGQTRGLSAFSNCAWLLDQFDGNVEAVTAAARMAACVGLVIERQGRMSGLTTTTDSAGNTRRQMTLEPGMIAEIGAGDKVTQVDPKNPSQNLPEFLATLGRLIGLSFGLPLEVAFLDFSRTNYSSARASLLQAQQVWQIHQDMMAGFSTEIYHWWLMREMREGRITPRRDALSHDWIKPGWKWVDPERELKAFLGAIDAGLDTKSRVAASLGRDYESICKTQEKDEALRVKHGLPDVRSTMTRDFVDPIALAEAQTPEPAEPAAPRGDE